MRISLFSLAAALLLAASPVFAQLPPRGGNAVPNGTTREVTVDPNNPASVTITATNKLDRMVVDHYYYDCLKKRWVWVSREWLKQGHNPFSDEFEPVAPPKPEYAAPEVKELRAGGPPGTDISPGDSDHAFNPRTGENFAWVGDGWVETKTGKKMPAPKLCPCPDKTATTPQPPPSIPPQPKLDETSQRILDIHNEERFAVGAPALRWDATLAEHASEYAQVMARTRQLVHSPREGRGIERENLQKALIGWGPDRMIADWVAEKRYFHPGIFPNVCTGEWYLCAHYTQMIWPTTTDIGCGMAQGGGFEWFVCRYSPGGNKDGKPVGMPVTSTSSGG